MKNARVTFKSYAIDGDDDDSRRALDIARRTAHPDVPIT